MVGGRDGEEGVPDRTLVVVAVESWVMDVARETVKRRILLITKPEKFLVGLGRSSSREWLEGGGM